MFWKGQKNWQILTDLLCKRQINSQISSYFLAFSEYMNFTITLTDFNNFKDETARLEAYVLIFMASYNSQNM